MKKLNLNTMFTIAAILLTFSGIAALLSFAVPSIKSAYGITDISTAFAFLIIGVAQLVFGVVAWSVRKDPASKTPGIENTYNARLWIRITFYSLGYGGYYW
ncbi:MAG: hypothetical protein WCE54_00235 [Ignavibacteriaceae bacterium]